MVWLGAGLLELMDFDETKPGEAGGDVIAPGPTGVVFIQHDDVNESNVFVGRDARVTLIDCDSWQVVDSARGRTYRSHVAKPDFLAAELQGRSLALVDRQNCHDNFALAVLIFKLVNEGTHPFDGVFRGTVSRRLFKHVLRLAYFHTLTGQGTGRPKASRHPLMRSTPSSKVCSSRHSKLGIAHQNCGPMHLHGLRPLGNRRGIFKFARTIRIIFTGATIAIGASALYSLAVWIHSPNQPRRRPIGPTTSPVLPN